MTPPVVVAPRLIYQPEVDTSGDQSGDVTLNVLVGSDGAVHEARTVSGPPECVAALHAVLDRYVFTPAMKGGVPTSAWIQLEVHFEANHQASSPSTDRQVASEQPSMAPVVAAPTPPDVDAPPAPEGIAQVEVVVAGERIETDAVRMDKDEIRQMPGAMGEPFRVIEAMPGVTPMVSGMPYFFVRGAPPGNVGYFIEGIEVPLLFHMGAGPAVFPSEMIDDVQLHSAAYPARLGHFSGGVVDTSLTPPAYEPRLNAKLRLSDVGAVAQTPVLGGTTDLLVAGRYSYIEPLVQLFAPDLSLRYWDYQARAHRRFGARDSVTVLGFGSSDSFGNDGSTLSSQFHRLDARFTRLVDGGQSTFAVTVGYDKTADDKSLGGVRDRSVELRADNVRRLDSDLDVRFGSDVRLDVYDVLAAGRLPKKESRSVFTDPRRFASAYTDRFDVVWGARADLPWQATRDVRVTPGLRTDVYVSDGSSALAIEPRISADYQITDSLSFNQGFGLAHEPPAFPVPVPGLQLANMEDGLQRSVQSSWGVQWRAPWDLRTSATLFHNAFFNSTDAPGLASVPAEFDTEQRTMGQAYGLELLVRRSLSRTVGGMLSYTLSRSTRSVGAFTGPAAWDRTHVFNAAVGYRWGHGIRTGARLVFYTGRPPDLIPLDAQSSGRSGFLAAKEDPAIADTVRAFRDALGRTRTNARRTAPFYRLDIRAEKRWALDDGASLALVLEVLNATLNKEEFDLDCTLAGCTVDTLGPLTIPNLSLELDM